MASPYSEAKTEHVGALLMDLFSLYQAILNKVREAKTKKRLNGLLKHANDLCNECKSLVKHTYGTALESIRQDLSDKAEKLKIDIEYTPNPEQALSNMQKREQLAELEKIKNSDIQISKALGVFERQLVSGMWSRQFPREIIKTLNDFFNDCKEMRKRLNIGGKIQDLELRERLIERCYAISDRIMKIRKKAKQKKVMYKP